MFQKRESTVKTQRKITGKRVLHGILALAAALCLTACSGTDLGEGFDEAAVKADAQKAVDYLIEGKYQECVEMMSQDMQAALTAEALGANVEAVKEQTGEFQEYKSITVVGQKDADGKDTAVAVVVAAFEKAKLTYTVSFDMNMEIIGLWMK